MKTTKIGICNMVAAVDVSTTNGINYLNLTFFQNSDTAGTFSISINGVSKKEIIELATNLLTEATKCN
jgi:hypothetical protein